MKVFSCLSMIRVIRWIRASTSTGQSASVRSGRSVSHWPMNVATVSFCIPENTSTLRHLTLRQSLCFYLNVEIVNVET